MIWNEQLLLSNDFYSQLQTWVTLGSFVLRFRTFEKNKNEKCCKQANVCSPIQSLICSSWNRNMCVLKKEMYFRLWTAKCKYLATTNDDDVGDDFESSRTNVICTTRKPAESRRQTQTLFIHLHSIKSAYFKMSNRKLCLFGGNIYQPKRISLRWG